ncbi:MAG TPA: class III lanthionine synthetase LanKC [Trebonia sp.]|nr:class III lanthionine synthetase LanKC [Trebonia sp.]
MDKQYELYCLADNLFYDAPGHSGRQAPFPFIERPLPADWARTPIGDWVAFRPTSKAIPSQGWKIHVSACTDNAAETLAAVWEYCVPREISFKVISSPLGILMRNMKYAPRAASGKAATIYPVDDTACERILRELDQQLGGAPGAYILSDLRYGNGPLYVRYGGFVRQSCLDGRGEAVAAIKDPAGRLVPDQRSPVFSVPQWVQLPGFLAPHLAARNSLAFSGLPYEVTGALHFSNGGGVYAATDKRDGARVILKEARPYAGLGADGSDAVARLRREHDLMRRLSGLGIAPEVLDYVEVGEHHFLIEERIDGQTLNSFFAGRHPLSAVDPDPCELAEYTTWAMRICGRVERAAALLHERGIVFNDLHMFNVMVRPDETVALIDFEAASDAGEGRLMTVGNPGFAAPRDRHGTSVDAYSLACLRLAMFMPLTALFRLDASKAAQLAGEIAAIFPVPDGYLDEAVTEITGAPRPALPARQAQRPPAPAAKAPRPARASGQQDEEAEAPADDPQGEELRARLVKAIRASATPGRADRLFPGDTDQFRVTGGGIGLGWGAAGVLFALWHAAGVREPDWEQWLASRAQDPPEGMSLGLYDGLSGVAWVMAALGHRDAAIELAARCAQAQWDRCGRDLFGGLAGLALALLDVADQAAEPALADAGQRAAEIVAGTPPAEGAAGLMHGPAGQALMLIRLHERTGDPGYLDAAAVALRADLSRCVTDRKGGLQVDEGRRTLPYLKHGSAGIGLVIDQFLAHREDASLRAAADQIAISSAGAYYAQPGLFSGRAGLLYYLAGRAAPSRPQPAAAAHVQRLAWHAVTYADGLAFPGDMLYRLSMDLGTGTAGVLLSVARAARPDAVALPGLKPLPALAAQIDPAHQDSLSGGRPELVRR